MVHHPSQYIPDSWHRRRLRSFLACLLAGHYQRATLAPGQGHDWECPRCGTRGWFRHELERRADMVGGQS